VATEVKLPRLGQGMESGTVVKWLKAEGEAVEKGEPLYELDTEKVTQEVEAEASGVLLRIAVPAGEVAVGTTVAFIGEPGEEVSAPTPLGDGTAGAEKPAEAPEREPERERGREAAAEAARTAVTPAATNGGRVKASPLARRIARERGIDLRAIAGTGPEGRVVADDVERVQAAPVAVPTGEVERVELTPLRRTIARRLTEAWQVPAFQLEVSAEMTRANGLLEQLRARDPAVRVTVTDLLVKVCAAALVRHREVNVQWAGDALLRLPSANVGIAVAAPQGLVVPVVRAAERLTLAEIAGARAEVVARAREGKLRREDLEGGTFTISNLGMFGVSRFTAVLNPPQAAILAVGATEERPVVVAGELTVRSLVTLTATFDHRAVDGAPAAVFLGTIKALLEEPGLAL
jgi:pyruvate dehydrogenase E2 component (dihydrolipoyllysine-residue acetyltransferase)